MASWRPHRDLLWLGAFLPGALVGKAHGSQPAWGRARLVGGLVKDKEQGPRLRQPEGALVPSKTQDALGDGSPQAGAAGRPEGRQVCSFPGRGH